MESIVKEINQFFLDNGKMILDIALTLVLGLLLIKLLLAVLKRALKRSKIDPIIIPYIRSAAKIVFYIVLFISVAGIAGFSTGSFVTILGTAGLAVSLALQNSLANMINGIFLMLSKPFKQGDYVTIDDVEGTVQSIGLIYTKLKMTDRQVLVPNSDVAAAKISDVSVVSERRFDVTFSVSYKDDIDQVRAAALGAVERSGFAIPQPPPEVVVTGFGESGVYIAARVWVKTENYWPFRLFIFEELKKTFDREGITIPYNLLEVALLGGQDRKQGSEKETK